MMKDKKLWAARIVMTVLSVAVVAFIFFRSMQNADTSEQESGTFVNLINRLLCSLRIDYVVSDHMIRKTAHFTEYTVLGVFLCVTMSLYLHKRAAALFGALGAGIVVAVCDELIQLSSAGRSCQLSDVLLDSSGVLCGALIVFGVIWLITRRKKAA